MRFINDIVTFTICVLMLLLALSIEARAAEIEIQVGEEKTRIVCAEQNGEMVIAQHGSGAVKVTLIDGYSWGCRYSDKYVFYDLSMPPVGMVGGVVVSVDFDF